MSQEIMKSRKKDHLNGFMNTYTVSENGFKDVMIFNNSLPELDFDEIDISTEFLGKRIEAPILINAITGGGKESEEINIQLAKIAKRFGIPMAVGSQSIGLKYEECENSFRCVRETIGKDGVVISNLSANKSLEDVLRAVEMIEADGIQLHLNVLQELCMNEGDRTFKGIVDNIKKIKDNIEVPVIAKEVGFGISQETAKKLKNIGIEYIDVGGRGGTNFVDIEDSRYEKRKYQEFSHWGIPTAASLILVKKSYEECKVISSGGIVTGEDVIKSCILGAEVAGISGALLKVLKEEGFEEANKYIEALIKNIKIYMVILGAKSLDDLKKVPYILKGELKELNTIL